jgi:phosphomannomutase
VPLFRTPVGEANVVSRMLEVDARIGGEGNGGVILPALHPGRDAMVGMALILQSLAASGAALSSLHAALPQYSMVKRSAPLQRPLSDGELADCMRQEFPGPIDTTDGVKVTLPEGWVHLRRSNTEPIVRAIAESRSAAAAAALAERALAKLAAAAPAGP